MQDILLGKINIDYILFLIDDAILKYNKTMGKKYLGCYPYNYMMVCEKPQGMSHVFTARKLQHNGVPTY